MNFGQQLATLRRDRQLTQNQMADLLSQSDDTFKKINAERISRWERGLQKPPLKKRRLIFKLFEIDIEPWLLDIAKITPIQINRAITYIQQRLQSVRFNCIVDNHQQIGFDCLDFKFGLFKNHIEKWPDFCDYLLDYTFHLKQHDISPQQFMEWLGHPFTIAKMFYYKGQIVGFVVSLPLSDQTYKEIIAGRLFINDLNGKEHFYKDNTNDFINLFNFTFYGSNRLICAIAILDEFLILSQCIGRVKYCCGFASSREGVRIANLFNDSFKVNPSVSIKVDNEDHYLIYALAEEYLDNQKLIKIISVP